ncbi:MAG: hypothetical protein WB680_00080 [Candidatus Acidiferrales bacterium]
MNSSFSESRGSGAASASSNSYRVEVSGWDDKESFFVEKTTLEWSEAAGKTIGLRSSVRQESVLFVRLIQPLGGVTGFPVPYRAVTVSSNYLNEHLTVKVEQLQPRMAFQETADSLLRADSQVA